MDHEKMVNKTVRELEKQGAVNVSTHYDNFPNPHIQKITITFEMIGNKKGNG